jgi:hypothetical protein
MTTVLSGELIVTVFASRARENNASRRTAPPSSRGDLVLRVRTAPLVLSFLSTSVPGSPDVRQIFLAAKCDA